MLPEIRKGNTLKIEYFPTRFQALIFRLWDMVPADKLAKVIRTDEQTVRILAADMGLWSQTDNELWLTRGYISILRHVWNILPYEQICELLDWNEDRLEFVLKEEDFLNIKLAGWDNKKTDCQAVYYRPLTSFEKEQTQFIKDIVERQIIPIKNKGEEAPFSFFAKRYAPLLSQKKYPVNVDNSWGIEVYCDGVSVYVDDFISEIKNLYNIELSGKSHRNIKIHMDLVHSDEEYHEISVHNDSIVINASTKIGVMRALYYILDLAAGVGSMSFAAKEYKRKTRIKTRFIYSFCGLYGDVLDTDSTVSFPDELIKQYARLGINGVWIQGIFYKLAPYPFDNSKCEGWEMRLENLDIMTKRLEEYGIKVYMYINEPRSMPDEFFKNNPSLRGTPQRGGVSCLCSSNQKTHDYLKNSVQTICKNVPLLGGFITITQSENLTLCYSHGIDKFNEAMNNKASRGYCPVCAKRKASDVVAGILKTMLDAACEINSKIKFFTYAWGWQRHFGNEVENLIAALPKKSIILQVSESGIDFERGGIKNKVMDYSLSIIGPGEPAKSIWKKAGLRGLEVAAKVQINNSWECSTAPFLPVYENVAQHMENLIDNGIEHIMLSWTLGGYVSDNIKIASGYFFEDEAVKNAYMSMLEITYGDYADKVKQAVSDFCKGFAEYPFDCQHIYHGPSNAGAANIIYTEPTGMKATMTCYPYDDLDTWCANVYPPDILKSQYEKLCYHWENGLEHIKDMPDCEFKDMAVYGYTLFKSSLNQIKYYMLRNKDAFTPEMNKIIKDEKNLALDAYEIMLRNSAVGYEAANHYYVTRSSLMEKIINCDYILSNQGGRQ